MGTIRSACGRDADIVRLLCVGDYVVRIIIYRFLKMIYNSFNFIILFPILFLLYYLIPAKLGKIRNAYLLVVSYLL